jgi:hypothetical protein
MLFQDAEAVRFLVAECGAHLHDPETHELIIQGDLPSADFPVLEALAEVAPEGTWQGTPALIRVVEGWCSADDKLRIAGMLVAKGADVNWRDVWDDQTALHAACRLVVFVAVRQLQLE